jgi:hypothetical protein
VLARSTQVHVPGGGTLDTPILIPSFSSKGFRVEKDGTSEVRDLMVFASEWLTDTMLVSAYDIHHGHVPRPAEWTSAPELTVIDSGGYETRVEHDLSTSVHSPHAPQDWNEELLRAVLDAWPAHIAATVVSYDHPTERQAFGAQVEAATTLFARYPGQRHTILLKPETDGQKSLREVLRQAVASPRDLAPFHFIGVTEKELGRSMIDRMVELAKLRLALDDANVRSPIHVFGALDPLSSCLYFLSGAEIFDGLTWLRYAYRDGLCVYQANHGVLSISCETRDDQVRLRTLTSNVLYLKQLQGEMKKFTLDGDFSHFKHNSDALRSEFDLLRTKLRRKL